MRLFGFASYPLFSAVVGCSVLIGSSALVGCGSDRNRGPGVNQNDGGTMDADKTPDATKVPDAQVVRDTGPDLSTVLVYAHSKDTLFTFSPKDAKVEEVGAFSIAGGGELENILDLAVDAKGEIIAVGQTRLFLVDKDTAVLSTIGTLTTAGSTKITGLVFVPANMFRSAEALVGADNEGVVYEIDRTTAEATQIGVYPDGWISSGDLVAVEGLGTFATVKKKGTEFDQLVAVTFGSIGVSRMELLGPIENNDKQFTRLFGIAYWGRDVYGFSDTGELLKIDRENARATLISDNTGAESFWGAGVTTQVPVLR